MATPPIAYSSVILPSRGLLYGDKIPGGEVQIRKLLVGEEAAIQSAASGLDVVSAVVSTAVKLPSGMNHLDLLVVDRMALLIALRVLTFGRRYTFGYKCQGCGADNRADCDLGSDLAARGAKDDLVEPVIVQLPDAGVPVGVRFLRGKDELNVAKSQKRAAAAGEASTGYTHVIRLAFQIVNINGEEVPLDKREEFVRNMTMPDSQAIRDALDELEPGIDMTVHSDCKSCQHTNDLVLPFSGDFFRSARRTPHVA